jgi:hypothetical protein
MGIDFDRPGTYHIRVKGHLDASWSDRLGGMEIKTIEQPGGTPETSLVGWLPDQAALCGVLNALYGLHFSLLSVELIHLEDGPRLDLGDQQGE